MCAWLKTRTNVSTLARAHKHTHTRTHARARAHTHCPYDCVCHGGSVCACLKTHTHKTQTYACTHAHSGTRTHLGHHVLLGRLLLGLALRTLLGHLGSLVLRLHLHRRSSDCQTQDSVPSHTPRALRPQLRGVNPPSPALPPLRRAPRPHYRVCFVCCHGGRGPCGFSPARPELANPTTLLTKCRAAYLQREGPARAQRRWELAAQGLQRQSAALWPEQRDGWDEGLHTTAQHYQADSEDHGALHVLHRVR